MFTISSLSKVPSKSFHSSSNINLYEFNQIDGKGTYPKVIWPTFAHKDECF